MTDRRELRLRAMALVTLVATLAYLAYAAVVLLTTGPQ